ncbi:MAG: hypothetical protein LBJ96_04780 [Holosporaceae bacterium]|jgi:hypothetical protein|nr:hypothetical protein [Holosporaceae bacterium]
MINMFLKVLVGVRVVLAVPICQGMCTEIKFPPISPVMQEFGIKASEWQSMSPPLPPIVTPARIKTEYGKGIEACRAQEILNRPEMADYRNYNRYDHHYVCQLFSEHFGKFNFTKIKKIMHNVIEISKNNGERLPKLTRAHTRSEALIMKYIEDHLSRISEIIQYMTSSGNIAVES